MNTFRVEAVAGMEYAPLLAAIHASSFAHPWSAEEFEDLLGMPGVAGAVAAGAEPIGFILWRAAADEAEVLTLAVLPAARRGGVGRRLVEHAVGTLAEGGVGRLFLEVAEDNAAAKALYARSGFSVVGRRRNYYRSDGKATDALVMEAALGRG